MSHSIGQAIIHKRLAIGYIDRKQGERAENLEQAIAHCKQALDALTREANSTDWAAIHSILAKAYRDRIRGDHAENLEQAIAHWKLALTCETDSARRAWANSRLAIAYTDRICGKRAENLEQAISHCKEALTIYSYIGDQGGWAWTQSNLAKAYQERIEGGRVENLELAIGHYKQALTVYTRQADSNDWAWTHGNLATAFMIRLTGEHAENLELAIAHCKQALTVYSRAIDPRSWAWAQNNLAKAYQERINGERAENLEQAIAHSKLALKVYARETFSHDWAIVHSNLAVAYTNRVRGERAENLEQAIAHCKQALDALTREANSTDWAAIHSILAKAYRDRIRGDHAENLEQAIAHWKLALKVYTRETFPENWAMSHAMLASTYWEGLQGVRAENVELACAHFKQALEVYTCDAFPTQWAATQTLLANVYRDRIRGDHAENLEQAIACCNQALVVYTREAFPHEWAEGQNCLALVYIDRIRGDHAENLEQAIAHCNQALATLTHETNPQAWAAVQNNLGIAYRDRVRGERAENLELAIVHYNQALNVYTRETFPYDWAMTQNNLALAYIDRVRGEREENLELAIAQCNQALNVYTRETNPRDWAATQSNLALAYRIRIRGERAENLELAIVHYNQALNVYTRETFPYDWAMTQNNLANVYQDRICGNQAENLEQTIAHYKLALEMRTREGHPMQWASTQHNLANAYWRRLQGNRAENLEHAIAHYNQALSIYTPLTLPQRCRDTALSLGVLCYNERRFAQARIALTIAHHAVEMLRGESVREAAKRRLGEENNGLYGCLVHCCLLDNDIEGAFVYAAVAKGRAFVDLLATARLDLSVAGADDPDFAADWGRTLILRGRTDALRAQLVSEPYLTGPSTVFTKVGIETQLLEDAYAALRTLHSEETTLWEELAYRYPLLTATQRAPTFTGADACMLAAQLDAILIEYFWHADGWCAFVVTRDAVQYVPLPLVDEDLLSTMLRWLSRIESQVGRGRLSYKALSRWHQAVLTPLQPYLPSKGIVIVAPFAWLHLLPLAAAQDPETGHFAVEKYTFALTPSLAALSVARHQARMKDAKGHRDSRVTQLLSVAYPGIPGTQYYLPNVLPEAAAVAHYFAQVTYLEGDAATPAAVVKHARGQDVIHLGCHGFLDPVAPAQSGLLLAGGSLTIQRIITELRLDHARLVTLGACLSGRIEVHRGEEHVGLLQAMLTAGARAVVASLWSVDDAATRALFEAFYARIGTGYSPATALRGAAQIVRTHPAWQHPYYWAAFEASDLSHVSAAPELMPDSDDVATRVAHLYMESIKRTVGGASMDTAGMIRDAEILLEQMVEESDEVAGALDTAELGRLVAGLRALEEQVVAVQDEAGLLAIAEAIHRLVEETAGLRALLLPEELDIVAVRRERSRAIDATLHRATADKDHYVHAHAAQIKNEIYDFRQKMEQWLPAPREPGSAPAQGDDDER